MPGPHVTNRPVLADEVRAIFGPIDDLAVAEIVASGATPAEVTEAHARLHGDTFLPPPSGRVARVLAILEAELTPPDEP